MSGPLVLMCKENASLAVGPLTAVNPSMGNLYLLQRVQNRGKQDIVPGIQLVTKVSHNQGQFPDFNNFVLVRHTEDEIRPGF